MSYARYSNSRISVSFFLCVAFGRLFCSRRLYLYRISGCKMMQILLAINGETCHVIRKPFFFFQDANCDGRLVKKDDREIIFFF